MLGDLGLALAVFVGALSITTNGEGFMPNYDLYPRNKPTTREFNGNFGGVCGPMPDIPNGYFLSSGGTNIGDQRRIFCENRYRLVGPDQYATCRFNGRWMFNARCVCDTCDGMLPVIPPPAYATIQPAGRRPIYTTPPPRLPPPSPQTQPPQMAPPQWWNTMPPQTTPYYYPTEPVPPPPPRLSPFSTTRATLSATGGPAPAPSSAEGKAGNTLSDGAIAGIVIAVIVVVGLVVFIILAFILPINFR